MIGRIVSVLSFFSACLYYLASRPSSVDRILHPDKGISPIEVYIIVAILCFCVVFWELGSCSLYLKKLVQQNSKQESVSETNIEKKQYSSFNQHVNLEKISCPKCSNTIYKQATTCPYCDVKLNDGNIV